MQLEVGAGKELVLMLRVDVDELNRDSLKLVERYGGVVDEGAGASVGRDFASKDAMGFIPFYIGVYAVFAQSRV